MSACAYSSALLYTRTLNQVLLDSGPYCWSVTQWLG